MKTNRYHFNGPHKRVIRIIFSSINLPSNHSYKYHLPILSLWIHFILTLIEAAIYFFYHNFSISYFSDVWVANIGVELSLVEFIYWITFANVFFEKNCETLTSQLWFWAMFSGYLIFLITSIFLIFQKNWFTTTCKTWIKPI